MRRTLEIKTVAKKISSALTQAVWGLQVSFWLGNCQANSKYDSQINRLFNEICRLRTQWKHAWKCWIKHLSKWLNHLRLAKKWSCLKKSTNEANTQYRDYKSIESKFRWCDWSSKVRIRLKTNLWNKKGHQKATFTGVPIHIACCCHHSETLKIRFIWKV